LTNLPSRGATTSAELVLGIDEAGRGSVLGPLVVGGFLVRRDRLDALRRCGATDSKALSPSRREEVFASLLGIGRCRAIFVPPVEIDRFVVRRGLNRLEAREFARLVSETAPGVAYVDACDPDAARFGRTVCALAGGRVRVVARHHADRDNRLVGAASIVAKVARDRAVAALAEELGEELGSGYPSDPRTVAAVRRHVRGTAPVPPWIRGSWSTVQRVKPVRPGPTLEAFGR
jgi:ribonuclease HII